MSCFKWYHLFYVIFLSLRTECTSRILLRYSVLMATRRRLAISEELTTTLAERREHARANPPTEGLNGELAFEYLTFGSGEIWRQVLKFL